MNKSLSKKGFTIIEVVLVLAIAALIFLMVFVALPGLQRSQRNTARKNAVGAVTAAVADYSSNNRSNMPSAGSTELDQYVVGTKDAGYTVLVKKIIADNTPLAITNHPLDSVFVFTNAKCGAVASTISLGSSARSYAVVTALETGTSGVVIYYCQNG